MTPVLLCATLLLAQVPDAGRPDARPLYYDRAVTDADLDGRSPADLALMRNTIYARAGRTFKNAKLRAHFTAQPWYRPAAAPNKLSAVDVVNLRAIGTRERALAAQPIKATCPPPWSGGVVEDQALAKRLSALARKLTWEDAYGPPGSCGRKVELTCGPDLDGDGQPESIVRIAWRLLLAERTCQTIRDDNDFWNVSKIFLVSGNPDKLRAVATLEYEIDQQARRAGAWFVRQRDGRIGVQSWYLSVASDTNCDSGAITRYSMERGKLRKVETRDDTTPCDP